MTLSVHYSTEERPYTGAELRPHYLLSELGVKGSALVAFEGPCKVETEKLVDWEDRLAGDRIEARRMVHFLGEFFGVGLREGVLAQRFLMAILGESLNARLGKLGVWRKGDDLFVGPRGPGQEGSAQARKLSVSIVTASPVSLLLHAGVNVDPAGAPVPAVGLGEMGVDAEAFAREVLERFQAEWNDLDWACAKVRAVV